LSHHNNYHDVHFIEISVSIKQLLGWKMISVKFLHTHLMYWLSELMYVPKQEVHSNSIYLLLNLP